MRYNKNVMGDKKYIFVVGGVLSGVGKGIMSASIGAILRAKGKKVSIQKCDPYLNVDAGLLDPKEHGEVFVTRDGLETDLDLGHYERFLDIETNRYSSTPSGALFWKLLNDERAGKYGGKTIQLVPHMVGMIKEAIKTSAEVGGGDVHVVEIGGTVGDYESMAFIEAIREFAMDVGHQNCLFVDVLFVPWLNTSEEFKTKPAQNAIRDLRGFGILPDIVALRTEKPAPKEIMGKIARLCGIPESSVALLPDVKSVFDVPLNIMKSGVSELLDKFVGYKGKTDVSDWEKLSLIWQRGYAETVKVGLVAKYVENPDIHLSMIEALKAAARFSKVNLEIVYLKADKVSKKDLAKVDGILANGDFEDGSLGGKVIAADFALENNKPYLGICLGMQAAVIAAAKRGGLKKAEETVVDSGKMQLGDRKIRLDKDSMTFKLYQDFGAANTVRSFKPLRGFKGEITERYRNRHQINPKFLVEITDGGLKLIGKDDDGQVEMVESGGKFFVGLSAHPEFRSRPMRPHPLFIGFINAMKKK